MSSYSAFQRFELLVAWFHDQLQQDRAGCHTELTRELAMVVRTEVGVEALLHNPEDSLRRVAMTYARSNAPALEHQVANAQFLRPFLVFWRLAKSLSGFSLGPKTFLSVHVPPELSLASSPYRTRARGQPYD